MGLLDKAKAKADQLKAQAEGRRAEASAERAASEVAAKQAAEAAAHEAGLDAAALIAQPRWRDALSAHGIDTGSVRGVINGNGGTISTASSGGMPNMRRVSVGVIVLSADDKLAYAIRDGERIEVVLRKRSEVDEMRKANMDGHVWVVFENDRMFPDRGDQLHRADNWEIPAPDRKPDAIRQVFLDAGYDV